LIVLRNENFLASPDVSKSSGTRVAAGTSRCTPIKDDRKLFSLAQIGMGDPLQPMAGAEKLSASNPPTHRRKTRLCKLAALSRRSAMAARQGTDYWLEP